MYRFDGVDYDSLDAVKAAVDNVARATNSEAGMTKKLTELNGTVRGLVRSEVRGMMDEAFKMFMCMRKQQGL